MAGVGAVAPGVNGVQPTQGQKPNENPFQQILDAINQLLEAAQAEKAPKAKGGGEGGKAEGGPKSGGAEGGQKEKGVLDAVAGLAQLLPPEMQKKLVGELAKENPEIGQALAQRLGLEGKSAEPSLPPSTSSGVGFA